MIRGEAHGASLACPPVLDGVASLLPPVSLFAASTAASQTGIACVVRCKGLFFQQLQRLSVCRRVLRFDRPTPPLSFQVRIEVQRLRALCDGKVERAERPAAASLFEAGAVAVRSAPGPRAAAQTPSSEVFDRLRRLLIREVNRICPLWLADEREDLVQKAMVKILELGEPDKPVSYLKKVAFTQMIDEIRRRQRRQEVSLDAKEASEGIEAAAVDCGPEAVAADRELGQALQACLASLVKARRRAVTLWLVGYPNREIAAKLQCNGKRAENLVTRGRADLRKCLERKGYRR